MNRYTVTAGDLGEPRRYTEFEPLTEPAPAEPAVVPSEPEKVPA